MRFPYFLSLVAALPGCNDLTAPSAYRPLRLEQAAVAPQEAPAPTKREPGAEQPAPTAPAEDGPTIEASHVLIGFAGAMRSEVTRSKEEAKALAEKVAQQAKAGQDFAELAKQHSDDKGSAARGGSLGKIPVKRLPNKPFADTLNALKPGEISSVIETPFGFHVIRRSP